MRCATVFRVGMKQINLRLDEDDLTAIDRERGLVPREAWLRQLIEYGRLMASSQQPHFAPKGPTKAVPIAPGSVLEPSLNRADAFRQAAQRKGKR